MRLESIDWIALLCGVLAIASGIAMADVWPTWFVVLCGFIGAFLIMVVVFGHYEVRKVERSISRKTMQTKKPAGEA